MGETPPKRGGDPYVERLELARDQAEDERYLRMEGYSDGDAARIAEHVAKNRSRRS